MVHFLKMKKRKKPFMSPIFMIFLTPGDAIKNDNVAITFGPFACAFLLISGDGSNLKRSKKRFIFALVSNCRIDYSSFVLKKKVTQFFNVFFLRHFRLSVTDFTDFHIFQFPDIIWNLRLF